MSCTGSSWLPAVQVLMTTVTVGSSLTVALLVPDKAEKIYAIVGATAVCVVCYVIPVFIQLQLYSRRRRRFKQRQQVGAPNCGAMV